MLLEELIKSYRDATEDAELQEVKSLEKVEARVLGAISNTLFRLMTYRPDALFVFSYISPR